MGMPTHCKSALLLPGKVCSLCQALYCCVRLLPVLKLAHAQASKSKAIPLFRSSTCIYIFKETIGIFQIITEPKEQHTNIEIEFGGNNYVSWFNFHIGRIQKENKTQVLSILLCLLKIANNFCCKNIFLPLSTFL